MSEEHHGENHRRKTYNLNINKLTVWKIISGVLAVLFIISVYTGGFKLGSDSGAVGGAQPAQPRQGAPSVPSLDMKVLIDDDDVKGDKNAPVTIVEWSDFECPFCTRFYEQTLDKIEEEYIKARKVKFVYRDFPLSFHKNAQKAAEAAECAGEEGKFWEMHDILFEKGVNGGINSFKQFAEDIGLNIEKFNDCFDSGKMEEEVKKDMQDGSSVGIKGTPGFIINGQLVSGAQPFSVFKQIIDAELK